MERWGCILKLKHLIRYLCLQATREGQASHAHVHEIVAGLRKGKLEVQLFEPYYGGSHTHPGILLRILEFIRVQANLWAAPGVPDLVYIRFHCLAFPTALWAKIRGIPVVQEVNGPVKDIYPNWPFARLFAPLLNWSQVKQLVWADEVITVTPGLAGALVTHIPGLSVTVIPNGANVSLFSPAARSARVGLTDRYTVFFGALAPWQGLDVLLRAVEDREWPPNLPLLVAGTGKERALVERTGSRNRLIRYLGVVPYRKLPSIVAGAAASFVTTVGQRAASPLKLYESMAAGVPVIVTNVPFQAEIVQKHHCGIIVDPEPSAIASAVKYLIGNPDIARSMGQRGRQAAVKEYSWNRRASETQVVIEKAMESRSASNLRP